MKRRFIFILAGCVTLALLTGCDTNSSSATSTALYTPTSMNVTSSATLNDLQQGRTLYVNNCGSCHSLYSPDNYSAASWKTIVPNMAGRTNMTQAQITLVTKYVTKGQ